MLKCKNENCGAPLTAEAEYDHGYLVMRCLDCGVLNVIALEVIGYRTI